MTALPTGRPPTGLLRRGRPPARALFRRRYDVRVQGESHVPRSGAVILASNHIGLLDGPLLAAFSPRPVHALTKLEMFEGRTGAFLARAGQIPLDRFHPDPAAIRTCLAVLEAGDVVGIYPEGTRGAGDLGRFHRGAAYLALVSGAPVVPVTMLGSREPGAGADSVPARGSRIDLVYGEPWRVEPRPWPRSREQVGQASVLLRRHMLAGLRDALELTGRELPGPLPPGDIDDDPPTGVVERGAAS